MGPDDELAYLVALHAVHHIGAARMARLRSAFPNLKAAWEAAEAELRSAGLDDRSVSALGTARRSVTPAALLDRLRSTGVRPVAPGSGDFPEALTRIDDAPPLLYVRGELHSEALHVAVVGTRQATEYGRRATSLIVTALVEAGATIVSGLARGIDTIAHQTAIERGGRTVAVLAGGLDHVYPPENRSLASEVAEHGALVTDYPPGTRPRPEFFPRRNRILSGMSRATVVVEGDHTSGAMITAVRAAEQGREVLAVPGSIFSSQSNGTNTLIRDGATPLTEVADVLQAVGLPIPGRQMSLESEEGATGDEDTRGHPVRQLEPNERAVLATIDEDPSHIDVIVRLSGLAPEIVSGTLAVLELKGFVLETAGLHYVRAR
jgi:DNA processing protein